MKCVILAGGTGSIALQTGLYNLLDKNFDGVDTKILINGYDAGLSTGAVRRVMGGKILGPSDLRKNQVTRLRLENPDSPWLKFLDIRFTRESLNARQFCMDRIDELHDECFHKKDSYHSDRDFDVVRDAMTEYFKMPFSTRISYTDFSLANIIYAGLAKAHDNSLRRAGSIMAGILGIKDNVLLNDDSSLFLGAVTASGKQIVDEGDIVSWGNVADPFVGVFFTAPEGYRSEPVLSLEAAAAISDADLIILSSGTLWSSLMPTYVSRGFSEAISASHAKIIMIMNREPDTDSPGQSAQDVIDLLTTGDYPFFEPGRLHVLADSTGSEQMNTLWDSSRLASFTSRNLEFYANKKIHDPESLAMAIGLIYFREHLTSDYYMFDYDDTLVGRGNSFLRASLHNSAALLQLNDRFSNVGICTGNSIRAINIKDSLGSRPLTVFADGGVNRYRYDTRAGDEDAGTGTTLEECINPSVLIPEKIIDRICSELLLDAKLPLTKIENRGRAIIAIKPIDEEYKGLVLAFLYYVIKGLDLGIYETGRSTIEIRHKDLSKAAALDYVLKTGVKTITYVGDEFDDGNDASILSHGGASCIQVKNPVKTAFFLTILLHKLGHSDAA